MKASVDRYYVRDSDEGLGPCMVLTSAWDSTLVGDVHSHDIKVLRLTDQGGWPPTTPNFLRSLPIVGVEVYSDTRLDLSVVEEMRQLELLALECEVERSLDLGALDVLRIALVTWPKKGLAHLFDRPALTHLNVSKYPYEDLRSVVATRLRRLQLTSRRLRSLDGVSRLEELDTLDLLDCPRLESIANVTELNALRILELDCCKKVGALDALQDLRALEVLVLTNCGDIESLKPLRTCTNLRHLVLGGNTSVVDGDLALVLRNPALREFRFRNRRHYNIKYQDVERRLSHKCSGDSRPG